MAKNKRRVKHKRGHLRRRYKSTEVEVYKDRAFSRRKMSYRRAQKYCSIKNGYTSKAARKDCIDRRRAGQFAGRKIHHRRKHG